MGSRACAFDKRARTPMKHLTLIITLVGIFLPYLARLPGVFVKGTEWFSGYFEADLNTRLLIDLPNMVAWVPLLVALESFRIPRLFFIPMCFCFGFLLFVHTTLALSSAQAELVFVFAPIWAFVFMCIGWVIAKVIERKMIKGHLSKKA